MAIDSNTKLLLQMEGDQSSYEHEITFGGGVDGILDSSTKALSSSVSSYDPNDGYILVADHAAFDVGSGDYTYEFFFKFSVNPSEIYQVLMGRRAASFDTGDIQLYYYKTTDQLIWNAGGGVDAIVAVSSFSNYDDSAWHHFAVSKSSGTTKIFIDGSQEDSQTTSHTMNSDDNFYIGAEYNGTSPSLTLFDEIRVSDSARYTTSFTPTTSQFTSDANTLFLWHCDGDKSGNHSITMSINDVLTYSTGPKFGNSALYINGSTNDGLIELATNSDFNFGTEDFTIDWWQETLTTVNNRHNSFNFPGSVSFICKLSNTAYIYFNGSSTEVYSSRMTATGWHHWAIVRQGTSTKIYLDGVLSNTVTTPTTINTTTGNLQIGNWGDDVETDLIDEFRVSKGIARWTENFTPPTASYDQLGYGISGNLPAESEVTVLRASDGQLLHRETLPAGAYEVEFNETGDVDVFARPTGTESPGIYTDVTPIEL